MPHQKTQLAALCLLVLSVAVVVARPFPGAQAEVLAPGGMQFQIPQAAVAITERQVCSLLDLQTGNGASIAGQDEGGSLRVGDASYWLFGDTELNNSQPLIANNIATARAADDPADCLQLDHKRSADNVAVPLLPPGSDPDEALLWPAGMVAAAPGFVHFFYQSVSLAVWPFRIRFVGLGKFDTATITGARVGGGDVSAPFWPLSYQITAARPVLVGDVVYVFLATPGYERPVKLARVARSKIENVAAYTYWDVGTRSFTANFALADAVISEPFALIPDDVSWNAFLGKWTMAYAGGFGRQATMRVANDITGPWSKPAKLFDCKTYYPGPGKLGTYCYGIRQHEELQKAGGETIYTTVSNEIDYRSFLHEIKLATPVRQYTDVSGRPSYVAANASAPQPAAADGIAFYAGASAGNGLTAIHQWISGSEVIYAPSVPSSSFSDGGVAFYAPTSADVSYTAVSLGQSRRTRVMYEPVYRWDKDHATPPVHAYSQFPSVPGYSRGPIAFYAPCPDTDTDGASDCVEASQGTDPTKTDTDGDGHADLMPEVAVRDPASDLAHDNCPAVPNADQKNSRPDFIDLHVYGKLFDDTTVLNSGTLGDACNPDIDGDGFPNGVEAQIGPTGTAHARCPTSTGPTDPLKLDTDGDGFADSGECMLGTDPADPASKPLTNYGFYDTDHDGLPDWIELVIGTDPAKPDSDGDKLNDGVEFLYYASDPTNPNTDGDICSDVQEASSFNNDNNVNSTDRRILVQHFAARRGDSRYVPDFDINKDGYINSIDMFIQANTYGACW